MIMLPNPKNESCKSIRIWLVKKLSTRFSISADWVQAHIVHCPRCRQRLSGFNRLALGFSLIKSQTHSRDLLKRANQQAIDVLQHSLRRQPQAHALRQKVPQPSFWKRLSKYSRSISHAAACLTLLLLMKIGVFSGMEKVQNSGQQAVEKYYAVHLGQELTDDIFKA